jgi:hypothetical protein
MHVQWNSDLSVPEGLLSVITIHSEICNLQSDRAWRHQQKFTIKMSMGFMLIKE